MYNKIKECNYWQLTGLFFFWYRKVTNKRGLLGLQKYKKWQISLLRVCHTPHRRLSNTGHDKLAGVLTQKKSVWAIGLNPMPYSNCMGLIVGMVVVKWGANRVKCDKCEEWRKTILKCEEVKLWKKVFKCEEWRLKIVKTGPNDV